MHMDWMQFISALVSALAWPIAVMGIVFMLKNPILNAIPKIRSFKYGELHIDLSEELKAVEDVLTANTAEPESPPQTPPTPSPDIVRLAEESPNAAIIFAWRNVEKAFTEAALRHGLVPYVSEMGVVPTSKIYEMEQRGLLDKLTVSTFKRLFNLRNGVVHGHGHGSQVVSVEDALSMAQSCEWLVERLSEA